MKRFYEFEKKTADGIRRRVQTPPVESEAKKDFLTTQITVEAQPEEALLAPPEASEGGIIITEPVVPTEEPLEIKKSEARRRFVWWGALSGAAAVVVFFIIVSTLFTRLTVKVTPRVEVLPIENIVVAFDISVSRVLTEQRVLPAERLEFSRKVLEEYESTGREFIEEYARGRVKVYNRFSSSPQTLVESTRFVTDSGIVYRLSKTSVIPGAKIEEGKIIPEFTEVELVAAKAGEDSNISGSVNLKIPGFKGSAKYEGFYATSEAGFSGGFKGEAQVVSRDDLTKAQEQATKKVYDEVRQETNRKVPPDFKLVEAFREVEITKVDMPRVGTRRDRFSISAEARARVLLFREEDVAELLKSVLLKKDGGAKDLIAGTEAFEYRLRSIDFAKGKAEVALGGSIKAKATLQEAELASILKGQKEGTIIELLKGRQEVADFSVSFFPPWIFKAPLSQGKIKIFIQEPKP